MTPELREERSERLLADSASSFKRIAELVQSVRLRLESYAEAAPGGPVAAPETRASTPDDARTAANLLAEQVAAFATIAAERAAELERRSAQADAAASRVAELERHLADLTARVEATEAALKGSEERLREAKAQCERLSDERERAIAEHEVIARRLQDDYQRARSDYEEVAREAMLLRNESLVVFIRRKWGSIFGAAPIAPE